MTNLQHESESESSEPEFSQPQFSNATLTEPPRYPHINSQRIKLRSHTSSLPTREEELEAELETMKGYVEFLREREMVLKANMIVQSEAFADRLREAGVGDRTIKKVLGTMVEYFEEALEGPTGTQGVEKGVKGVVRYVGGKQVYT